MCLQQESFDLSEFRNSIFNIVRGMLIRNGLSKFEKSGVTYESQFFLPPQFVTWCGAWSITGTSEESATWQVCNMSCTCK